VSFEIAVPADTASGDHNVMLFFEMFADENSASGTAQSNVSGRIGSRIRLRVEGELVSAASIEPFIVPAYVIGAKVPYDFTVNNTGNVDQRIVAQVKLLNRNDQTLARETPVPGRLVFAGQHLAGAGHLSPVKQLFGPQSLRIEVTPVDEDGQPLRGEAPMMETRSFWMIPAWLLAVIAGALLFMTVWVVWTLVTRSLKRRTPPPAEAGTAAPIAEVESVTEPAGVEPDPNNAAPGSQTQEGERGSSLADWLQAGENREGPPGRG